MKVPICLVNDLAGRQFQDGCLHQAVLVLRRTLREPLPEFLLVKGEQDVSVVDKIERDGRLVFRETIHPRRRAVSDEGKVHTSGWTGVN